MSPHERERLAAWMDGELPPDERREVESHLAECEECAALLADMEAVDDAMRELPAEAPAGYFEDFAGRVRTRIEGSARRGAPTRWRTPPWTWAAAAALLLGVVTPLTLARLGRDGAPEPATAALTSAKDVLSQTAESGQSRAVEDVPAGDVDVVRERALEPTPAAPEEALREEPKKESRPATPESADRDDTGLRAARDDTYAPAPSAAGFEERTAGASVAEAEAPSPGAARAPAATPRRQAAAFADAPASAPEPRADAERPGREADDEALAQAVEVPLVGHPAEGRKRREGTASGGQAEKVQAFGLLTRSDPQSAEAWRERREAWRLFIRDHPGSPRLDEARVRVIEAGIEAWRAAGEGEDLARAREDAEAYLARADARQKERVRRVLEDVGER